MRQKMFTFGLHDVFVFNIQIGSGSCSCGNRIHTPTEHPLTAARNPVAQRGTFGYLLWKLGTLGRPLAESSKGEGKWTGEDASVVLGGPTQPGMGPKPIPIKEGIVLQPTSIKDNLNVKPTPKDDAARYPSSPGQNNKHLVPTSTEQPAGAIKSNFPQPALMGAFVRLPLEIRHMIWELLLISPVPIKDAQRFVDLESIQKSKILRTGIVNAKILHTCRSIYNEAMPVLYNKNMFMFTSPQDVEDFAHDNFELDDEIFHLSPRFCIPNAPCRRLSLIHSVILRIGGYCYHLRDIPAQNAYLWSKWRCFFVSKFADELVGFPALRKLYLDFSEWRLTAAETDSLSLCAIIKKLKESGGLNLLIVKGISEKQTLYDLLHGLVKDGGRFCVWDAGDRAIIDIWHRSGSQLPQVESGHAR